MKNIFDKLSADMSAMTTKRYSTSFSLGIRFLHKDIRKPIYAIYGFVRFADEIVDSFHQYDKAALLEDFAEQTWRAIEQKVSLNPILNSFQETVRKYAISQELIRSFLESMHMDLENKSYSRAAYEQYIFGSAEVVGLMCLKVFLRGDEAEYDRMKESAMKLGSAFQKVNFLRDLQQDMKGLGRVYFPEIVSQEFDDRMKTKIEADIEVDFKMGYLGIKELPKDTRFGVYMAYVYYYKLFNKIKRTQAQVILNQRVRIPNNRKYALFFYSYVRHNFNRL